MTPTSDPKEMVARVRSLRPQIESYTDEAERLCRMPDGLARIFSDEGIFNMARPINRGGMAMDVITTMDVVEEISIADASAGWCAAIGSGSIGTFPLRDDVAEKVYRPGEQPARQAGGMFIVVCTCHLYFLLKSVGFT